MHSHVCRTGWALPSTAAGKNSTSTSPRSSDPCDALTLWAESCASRGSRCNLPPLQCCTHARAFSLTCFTIIILSYFHDHVRVTESEQEYTFRSQTQLRARRFVRRLRRHSLLAHTHTLARGHRWTRYNAYSVQIVVNILILLS